VAATAQDIDNTLNKPVSEILDPESEVAIDSGKRAGEGDDLLGPL